jgi:hypothetical protein
MTFSPGSGELIAAKPLVKPSAQALAALGEGRNGFVIILSLLK